MEGEIIKRQIQTCTNGKNMYKHVQIVKKNYIHSVAVLPDQTGIYTCWLQWIKDKIKTREPRDNY